VALALVAAVAAGGWLLWFRDEPNYVPAPWDNYRISADGRTLTLWVQKPHDPGCLHWGKIDIERRGQVAVVTALNRRTSQVGCIVPCPLQALPHSETFDFDLRDYEIRPGREGFDCRDIAELPVGDHGPR
jgi:hypothetical protein